MTENALTRPKGGWGGIPQPTGFIVGEDMLTGHFLALLLAPLPTAAQARIGEAMDAPHQRV